MRLLLLTCAVLLMEVAVNGVEESCGISGTGGYENGMQFTSLKDDGTSYACRCGGFGCRKMSCEKILKPATTTTEPTIVTNEEDEDNDDAIIGMVPGQPVVIEPVVAQPSIANPIIRHPVNPRPVVQRPVILLPQQPIHQYTNIGDIEARLTDPCFDRVSRRTFQRGDEFYRTKKNHPRKKCVCPSRGPNQITCRPANCDMASTPLIPASYTGSSFGGCYDAWNQREYASGAQYTRTRFMDPALTINGTYSCSCSGGMMRCSAIDIPCCDTETGQWVNRDEKFFVMSNSFSAKCVCQRGRQRYSHCISLETPGGQQGRCYDSRGSRHVDVGSNFQQDRGYRGIWSCTCNRSLRLICRYVSSSRQG
nr:uncharacterized protein LOC100178445 isoform X2 [Ciona intestinalis]|eukprot:XP_002119564.2 uncharacterized protein LOC100178445 isoform X2 [Ciona intestinalis]